MISCRFTLNHKVSVKVKKCLCQTCVLSPDVSGSSVATKMHYSYWVRASLMCLVIIMKVPWCCLNSTALGDVKASSLFLHCELKIKLNYTQEVNCWQDTVYSVVVMGTGAQSAFHSKHICISVAGAFFVTFSFTLLYQLVLLQIYVLDRGNSWMTISSNHVWSDHVAANGVDLTWFAPSVKYLTIKDGACENLTCTTNVIHLGYCFSAVRLARFAVTNKGQCAVTRCYFWFHQYTITKHEHNTNITFLKKSKYMMTTTAQTFVVACRNLLPGKNIA